MIDEILKNCLVEQIVGQLVWEISKKRFPLSAAIQHIMDKITENLEKMFGLQEGFNLSLGQAKLLYKGENRFPMINKAIYDKITDSSDESNATLTNILNDLNKQMSEDEESLSLKDFPSNFLGNACPDHPGALVVASKKLTKSEDVNFNTLIENPGISNEVKKCPE